MECPTTKAEVLRPAERQGWQYEEDKWDLQPACNANASLSDQPARTAASDWRSSEHTESQLSGNPAVTEPDKCLGPAPPVSRGGLAAMPAASIQPRAWSGSRAAVDILMEASGLSRVQASSALQSLRRRGAGPGYRQEWRAQGGEVRQLLMHWSACAPSKKAQLQRTATVAAWLAANTQVLQAAGCGEGQPCRTVDFPGETRGTAQATAATVNGCSSRQPLAGGSFARCADSVKAGEAESGQGWLNPGQHQQAVLQSGPGLNPCSPCLQEEASLSLGLDSRPPSPCLPEEPTLILCLDSRPPSPANTGWCPDLCINPGVDSATVSGQLGTAQVGLTHGDPLGTLVEACGPRRDTAGSGVPGLAASSEAPFRIRRAVAAGCTAAAGTRINECELHTLLPDRGDNLGSNAGDDTGSGLADAFSGLPAAAMAFAAAAAAAAAMAEGTQTRAAAPAQHLARVPAVKWLKVPAVQPASALASAVPPFPRRIVQSPPLKRAKAGAHSVGMKPGARKGANIAKRFTSAAAGAPNPQGWRRAAKLAKVTSILAKPPAANADCPRPAKTAAGCVETAPLRPCLTPSAPRVATVTLHPATASASGIHPAGTDPAPAVPMTAAGPHPLDAYDTPAGCQVVHVHVQDSQQDLQLHVHSSATTLRQLHVYLPPGCFNVHMHMSQAGIPAATSRLVKIAPPGMHAHQDLQPLPAVAGASACAGPSLAPEASPDNALPAKVQGNLPGEEAARCSVRQVADFASVLPPTPRLQPHTPGGLLPVAVGSSSILKREAAGLVAQAGGSGRKRQRKVSPVRALVDGAATRSAPSSGSPVVEQLHLR